MKLTVTILIMPFKPNCHVTLVSNHQAHSQIPADNQRNTIAWSAKVGFSRRKWQR